jgi:hypothetical protein
MTTKLQLVIEVEGGCVRTVWGSEPPHGIEIDFIVRDLDNIADGDDDPTGELGDVGTYIYW